MEGLPFIKMHGLGNDFVIIDGRVNPVEIGADAARRIADRHTGIGCDQLIVLAGPRNADAQAFMTIRNADGGESAACGNATRCVAALLMDENGTDQAIIETEAGILVGEGAPEGITLDMASPRTDWRDIPLAGDHDTAHLPLGSGPVADPAACSMGNPHATFFVDDVEAIEIAAIGPGLEHDPIFPERANIGFAQVVAADRIRLRVWERGAGLTSACATGACAAVVNGVRRGLLARRVRCILDGGELVVEWRERDGHVLMTGPTAVTFTGLIGPGLLDGGTP
ncbi:MAG: diaminopimelate epimerase [Alphaproteobacteria bacterium]|nr:MAG: diaminopimelate epimerase [Alphaproteobacteria bacterium]